MREHTIIDGEHEYGINERLKPSGLEWLYGSARASSISRGRRKMIRAVERGYVLLAVLFLAVMILIALAVAAPKVAADIERDREVELMHRGMQYRRAIQLYYRKFGAYPPNMEALEKTNQIRFLRKRYRDPVTGKDEWHLIHFGENKLPTVMGFFGQAMGGVSGSTLAGTGPGGVGQSLGAGLTPSNFGGGIGGGTSGGLGGSSIGGSSFGNNSTGGSSFGNNSIGSGNSIGNSLNGSAGTSDPNAGNANANGTGTTGSNTTGSNGTGTNQGTGSSDPNAGSNGSASSSFMSGSNSNGQTFGGGGIIGIESTSPKATILEYKKTKHFNQWEFVYDPASERTQVSGNLGTIGQPMSGAGNSPSINSPGLNGGNPNLPNGGNPGSPNGNQPINAPNPPSPPPDGNQPNPQ